VEDAAFERSMPRVAVSVGVALLISACAGGPSRLEVPKPAGLVWYHDPSNRSAAIAVDWSGRQARRLALPMPSDGGRPRWTQSPDGQYLLLWNGEIRSKSGKLVAHLPPTSSWADDSRHLCAIRNGSGDEVRMHTTQVGPGSFSISYDPAFLFVYGMDSTGRILGPTPGPNPHGGVEAVCDFADDRALVVTSFVVSSRIAEEFRLSTGAETPVPSGPLGGMNLYTNGRLVVSSPLDLTTNSIRRAEDGVEVGRLSLGQVRALSADGHVAAMAVPGATWPSTWTSSPVVKVIDTRTRTVVWSLPGSLEMALSQPGGDWMAVFLAAPSGRFDDLWLVRSDGRAARVASRVPNGSYLSD
jgi:hypothetical protein